ncbi:MAG: transcription-repair coupling factor [Clostridia bacterium]
MDPIIREFSQNSQYLELLKLIKKEKEKISIIGLNSASKAHIIYGLTINSMKSSVIVCPNNFEAKKTVQDLKFYSNIEIIYLPSRTLEYYDIDVQSKEIENSRMYAIEKILNTKLKIVVTTIDALMIKMLPRKDYIDLTLNLKVGFEINISKVCADLVKLGYEKSNLVEGKGQFAIRGSLIDIFAINSELPYRIELFGNEIDSIRTFDPITQRSIDVLNQIKMSHAAENNINQADIENGLRKLKDFLKTNSDDKLKSSILEDIEKIESGNLENIVDKYFEIFVKKYETLLDYFENYSIYIDEISKCIKKSQNVCYENIETIKTFGERGYIHIPFVNKYIRFEEIENSLKNYTNIYLENLAFDKSVHTLRKLYVFETKELNFFKSGMDILLNDIIRLKKIKAVLLVFPTDNRVEQIKNYLKDNKIIVKKINDVLTVDNFCIGEVYITKAILSSGYDFNNFNLAVIAESVNGVKSSLPKKIKKTSIGSTINSFEDLEIGDYIVHENHGIGIYKGIETIRVEDTLKDYIKLEYSDRGALYVPINQLDLVKKYVCDDDTKPKLNCLGTKQWEQTKRKVTTHVKQIAKELMLLYAKREEAFGFAFSKDTQWQKEFEDSFEYELTNDQKTSLMEIKQDMEDAKPMDRLLCGDVGYGKTELALRATFKAIMSGKQVAYLVPTTVLSLQQYTTFKSRMESFGIKVEMLSRFKTKKEQTEILKKLVDGKIDVVIGTHRLLSKDVFFENLGLLIIDEEHRFGVKAKESIKQLKESIDVLSMTATPIPRTLHMSMIGIRKMSTLTEPPLERIPVHTYVLEYDENVVKEAIEKELSRDGQVFYINNSVANIESVTQKVRDLVPYAKVAYAHGQMNPEQIENIMLKFMNHELDVIVCTTILESGIDIKNANTLIIENADKLGLAQLYQIRGRVGRSNRLAYAYITYEKNKQISEVSSKRLKAIKDFTEFGSGFKIALRDLEIRGAGNLLGKEQHGHMAKVGYEMYLALLEKAIREEKGGKDTNAKYDVQKEVKIDIDISAYISDEYIKDPLQKISMYQKISDINTKEETMDVIDELLDRYGEIPKETENLIKIVEIRNECRQLGISKIIATKKIIKFEPCNFKIQLTKNNGNDILLRVQLELDNINKMFIRKEEK